ncbi:transmembrane protein 51a [Syngnathus typhle]|uniref:transmembrane protein 51a n=1 Tax=Syngnathus typhle TaxID=161592 RepID=UPI002A6ACB9C|nr:transmembrane protein 51a [Syngnathus typhle]XP_061125651.1 transmembrane protein 51a [Syngnathus typhle]XP_061125661.1 transmembrane protein 51a [Syngnathus typhle]XP_061125670.1 transmembrane protein 51a [Syngnathus typhle]
MRSSVDGQASPLSRGHTNDNNNNNNNNSSSINENNGNSGSQYALCALGVGLVALGIVMIVWSVVPASPTGNNSNSSASGGEGDSYGNRKSKASSVAFVLVASGVVMLMLSLCLGMRNKQREQRMLQEAQNRRGVTARENGDVETAEQDTQRYAVPTYEEAVGSGHYPVRQSNLQPSPSQLPSYDDLVQVDGVRYEIEGAELADPGSQLGSTSSTAPAALSASNRKPGKSARKLLPIKIRRIKSEKVPNCQPTASISIEPLTPPPQYDDKVAPL